MVILLIFALLAGITTVVSPCILPVLPLLLVATNDGHRRPWGIVCGLICSFTFFTLSLSALVQATGISPNHLRFIAVGLIIFFGITMIFPTFGEWVESCMGKVTRLGSLVQKQSGQVSSGFLSGFVLGFALGLLWSPCAGPILATITTLVATSAITLSSILITLAYSLGAAIPMLLIMYGGKVILASTKFVEGYTVTLRKIFGVFMIIGALLIGFHGDVVLQHLVADYLPKITIEDNEMVRKELEKLRPKGNPHFSGINQKAPDFVGISQWINSDPLTLEQLLGKVVLIDFWTYSCINCVRTLPYLKEWYKNYKDKGLIIVGVHTPEFEFEKDFNNVKDAVKRFALTYPVALDNGYKTWQNYNNHYWPAHYLIDQHGVVREQHSGEGGYQETEAMIRSLLGLSPLEKQKEEVQEVREAVTPEIYLGYRRAQAYGPEITLKKNQVSEYDYKNSLGDNHVGLKGSWVVGPESVQSKSDTSILELNFMANRVYLVMSSATPQMVTVLLDGKAVPPNYYTVDMNAQGTIMVDAARMYDLLDLKGDAGRHLLTLQVPQGVEAYAFTFGAGSK